MLKVKLVSIVALLVVGAWSLQSSAAGICNFRGLPYPQGASVCLDTAGGYPAKLVCQCSGSSCNFVWVGRC